MATPPSPKRVRLSADVESQSGRGVSASPRRPRTPSRPSFATPTKASIARHNPDLISGASSRRPRLPQQRALRRDVQMHEGLSSHPTPEKLMRDIAQSALGLTELLEGNMENDANTPANDGLSRHVQNEVMQAVGNALDIALNSLVTNEARAIAPELASSSPNVINPPRGASSWPESRRNTDGADRRGSPPESGSRETDLAKSKPSLSGIANSIAGDGPSPRLGHLTDLQVTTSSPSLKHSKLGSAKNAKLQDNRQELQIDLERLQCQLSELEKRCRDELLHAGQDESSVADLIDLLDSEDEDDQKQISSTKANPLSLLLNSFLPFSTPSIMRAETFSAQRIEASQSKSHKPVSNEETMDFLRFFFPLLIEHSISTQDTSPTMSAKLAQTLDIKVMSPNRFIFCHLGISLASHLMDQRADLGTSDAYLSDISAVSFNYLSPELDQELGNQLRDLAARCDIVAIGQGISQYHQISMLRAKCWDYVQEALASYNCGDERGKQCKVKMDPVNRKHGDQHSLSSAINSTASRSRIMRKLTFNTPSSLQGKRGNTKLAIEWAINLDLMTGDAVSRVNATVNFPSSFVNRSKLSARTTKMFHQTVRKHGVAKATLQWVPVICGKTS